MVVVVVLNEEVVVVDAMGMGVWVRVVVGYEGGGGGVTDAVMNDPFAFVGFLP